MNIYSQNQIFVEYYCIFAIVWGFLCINCRHPGGKKNAAPGKRPGTAHKDAVGTGGSVLAQRLKNAGGFQLGPQQRRQQVGNHHREHRIDAAGDHLGHRGDDGG